MAGVPPELELKPWALGQRDKVPGDKTKAIQKELERRLKLDQDVRKKMMDPAMRAKIKTEADARAFQEEAAKIDRDNTRYLKSLVGEIGWIDAERFGANTANAAFLIVQHSGDLRLMMAALPEIEKDLKAKRIDGQGYALLYDRLKLRLGEKQRYGTQVDIDPSGKGTVVVLPLENRAKVDEFRKEIGMFPLSRYLDMIKQMTGAKEIVFRTGGEP
jgi:hypothetical protein